MRIVIFLIFVSIHAVGSFPQTAWSEGLQVVLENEVAGLTPGMTLLQKTTGNLDQPNNETGKPRGANSIRASNVALAESRKKLRANPYARAGFISKNLTHVGKVLKVLGNKLATTGPEKLFIDIGRQQGLESGDKFTVYSQERYIYHPVLPPSVANIESRKYQRRVGFAYKEYFSSLGKPMGHVIMIRGVLQVTEVGETTSYANILKAYEGIKPGEFLIPYQETVEPVFAGTQNRTLDGYIVATKEDRIGVGVTDIVYIDKGWGDGVRVGEIFEVYHIPELMKDVWYKWNPERTPLLPDVLGELKIVKTEKNTATAVIVQNNYDMQVGNKIRTKR